LVPIRIRSAVRTNRRAPNERSDSKRSSTLPRLFCWQKLGICEQMEGFYSRWMTANRKLSRTAMWEAGPHTTNSHEHVYRRISLASSVQNLSQQNQQLNLVGGCNAIKSRDLKIVGRIRSFDPHRPMVFLRHYTAFEYECSGCSNWNPIEKTKKRKNAANSNVFGCSAKLPKLRTWVRFPSPAPEILKTNNLGCA
jgi:hypothetical protein